MADLSVKIGADLKDFQSAMAAGKSAGNEFAKSIDKFVGSSKNLNQAFRNARKEAMELGAQYAMLSQEAKNSEFGQALAKQFAQAKQAAGQLLDLKSDIQQEIKNISSDTVISSGISQGVGVLSSGLQGLASAFGLAGDNCESFQRALVAVNAVQAASNTITGISNALQKQSAFMVMLRTVRSKMFTAAVKQETVAIGEQTAAQRVNNAVAKANPYVAIASAVIVVTSAIIAWKVATDDANESLENSEQAVDAMKSAMESEISTLTKKLQKFEELRNVYIQNKNNSEVLTKEIYNNKEAQKLLGVEINNTVDAENLFINNANAYYNAVIKMATANAQMAAGTAVLNSMLTDFAKLQADITAGRDVSYVDFIDKLTKLTGGSIEAAQGLMKAFHFSSEASSKVFFSMDKGYQSVTYTGEDIGKDTRELFAATTRLATKRIERLFNKGARDLVAEAEKEMKDNGFKPNTPTTGGRGGRGGGRSGGGNTRNTEVQRTLATEEGIAAIISDEEKKQKALNTQAANYNDELVKSNAKIVEARIALAKIKASKGLPSDLAEANGELQKALDLLPRGSKQAQDIRETISDINGLISDIEETDLKTPEDYEKIINDLNNELKKSTLEAGEQERIIEKIVRYERLRDAIVKQQERQKAVVEMEAKFRPETVKEVKERFGDRLEWKIDLFADAKTDKEVLDIARSYRYIFGEMLRLPKDANTDVNAIQRKRVANAQTYLQGLQGDYDIGIIDEDTFLRKWEAIKTYIESEGLTVTVEPQLKTKQWQSDLEHIGDAINNIGEAFGSLSEIEEDPMLKVAGIVAQAIANIALGAGKAMAQAGALGPWGWLAFGTSVMAQMVAMIAQIHSATGFAKGGIVGGNDHNDGIIARLSSGEMVLNKTQQGNLFRLLDGQISRVYGSDVTVAKVVVKGSDLHLALKNYDKTRRYR